MAYATYKNRHSFDYRFTVTELSDPTLADLKDVVKKKNECIISSNRRFGRNKPTYRVVIKNRGPRVNRWAKDTRREDATHYDIYVYYRYNH